MPNTKQEINKGGSRNSSKTGTTGKGNSSDSSNRGFASMDPQKQREIASEGGKASHASGNAHEFDSNEARRLAAKVVKP